MATDVVLDHSESFRWAQLANDVFWPGKWGPLTMVASIIVRKVLVFVHVLTHLLLCMFAYGRLSPALTPSVL